MDGTLLAEKLLLIATGVLTKVLSWIKNRSHGLIRGHVGHVNSELAVVHIDGLERPDPVPVHEHGSLAVVEGHVSTSKLLVADKHSHVTLH